ncbi:MAG: long-chain fatty acid--CoA ligase [Gemmatimonadetes bacterium]|nr:long-chain fatty acid--CoA ligase [Gemmatimonadota bacterium]
MLDSNLVNDLVRLLRRGVDSSLDDDAFGAWAVRIFAYQYAHNSVYARYCQGRGVTPDTVRHWSEIPPVPTSAFKELALVCGSRREAQAVFETSGTTRGTERRGRHYVLDLTLYDESLLPNFHAHLLPDREGMPMLALLPSPLAAPSSSLSYMLGCVMDRFGTPGSTFVVEPDGHVRYDDLHKQLDQLGNAGSPVCLLGTAFSFVHWLDRLTAEDRRFRLPAGSRIMETGGFKGRSRVMERDELYESLGDRLGIPADHIVNEYGMTEMLSQFYEPVLRWRVTAASPRLGGMRPRGPDATNVAGGTGLHVPPPWVRTRVLDPVTLEPVPRGEVGILQHFDLANLGSVCAILTEDLGVLEESGFRLLRRIEGAEPRGCSIAMDELLAARGAAST